MKCRNVKLVENWSQRTHILNVRKAFDLFYSLHINSERCEGDVDRNLQQGETESQYYSEVNSDTLEATLTFQQHFDPRTF